MAAIVDGLWRQEQKLEYQEASGSDKSWWLGLWRRQWRLREEMVLSGHANKLNAEVMGVLQVFRLTNLVGGGNMH